MTNSSNILHENTIPVIFATDDGYIPYLAVAIVSLIQSASRDRHYRIHILAKEILSTDRSMLFSLVKGQEHISLDFIDIRPYLEQYAEDFYTDGISHISTGAYYRFFIPKIFSGIYEKALYLDCDIVILNDLVQLYDYDLGSNLLAATRDYGSMFSRKIGQSITQVLGLSSPQDYFNSGILLINIRKFEEEDTFNKLFTCLKRIKTPPCHDQDILNIVCEGRVLFLSEEWNCKSHVGRNLDVLQEKMLPEEYHAFLESRNTPKIIHYTSSDKPWNRPEPEEFDYLFWEFARQCPYYETILRRFLHGSQSGKSSRKKPSLLSLWKYELMIRISSGARREHYERKKKRLLGQLKRTSS